ncbi:MAG TPA: selenocysteine-specific translation elongation factor [Bryobacteraceae bacterium]|jgi:selenocysteine-specific elongation factor|nr:selenocysteine-specific translation elongation factor [Bryobacteraceae bacterium]
MKHIIVGTAGHIDHGKTALVKALTGIDADRLEEEKRRGITIDLGFAHLQIAPQLRLGFVDVPGHERFVKNMLAGVGGIDLVLFVIAADESIKPQTREHFDICRLLGIGRGVIALTKADLVDADILGLVRLEVEEMVQGSFLEGAATVPVSSVSGVGLDDLRTELVRAAEAVTGKSAEGHFRLPVDRVFSVKGFGTVATGTLISGSVAKEQAVELYPRERTLRVRGVEVHGEQAARAVAGERTAVNLADIEPGDLARGDVLSEPGRFRAVTHLDCRLNLLPSAKPLKHRAPVHFHAGTAEIQAEVRLLGRTAPLAPGSSAFARMVLRRAALILPGDRFIIRMFSPVVTIGGGVVLDLPASLRSAGAAQRLATLETSDDAGRVALLVGESQFGAGIHELVARTGWTEARVASAASRASLLALGASWYVDPAWFQAARARLVEAVRAFHRESPLAAGIAKQDLRARVMARVPPLVLDALLAAAAEIAVEGETVRLRTHSVVLQQDEEQARAAIERAFETAGLAVPPVAEVLAASGVELKRARTLLESMVRQKRLLRINQELVFHSGAIERLRQILAPRKAQHFGVGEFKEWTGISRKYAIPLLEYLDREHVTRREGDRRLVL